MQTSDFGSKIALCHPEGRSTRWLTIEPAKTNQRCCGILSQQPRDSVLSLSVTCFSTAANVAFEPHSEPTHSLDRTPWTTVTGLASNLFDFFRNVLFRNASWVMTRKSLHIRESARSVADLILPPTGTECVLATCMFSAKVIQRGCGILPRRQRRYWSWKPQPHSKAARAATPPHSSERNNHPWTSSVR